MGFETICYEQKDQVGWIKLNRPEKRNALNDVLLRELSSLFSKIATTKDIRVVVLTGEGKFFAAGADINELAKIKTPFDAREFLSRIEPAFCLIESIPQPVIAAVNGPALGGGCELCLACDIRIASENALFGQPEINLGIIPGAGGTQRLPRLIGLTKAKEMLFRGKPIDAQEAYRIGLVNRVVPQDELVAACGELADELASQPYIALTVTKDVVNRGINVDLQSALAIEARAFALLFATEDQKEGVQAFLEKRKPNFQGK